MQKEVEKYNKTLQEVNQRIDLSGIASPEPLTVSTELANMLKSSGSESFQRKEKKKN
jgi:16S rRNA G527 N7-methylase RsmG